MGKCFMEKGLWRVVPATGFGKTKPNLGKMGYLVDAVPPRRRWRETKPISPPDRVGPDRGEEGRSCDIASMPRFGKRTQFRRRKSRPLTYTTVPL